MAVLYGIHIIVMYIIMGIKRSPFFLFMYLKGLDKRLFDAYRFVNLLCYSCCFHKNRCVCSPIVVLQMATLRKHIHTLYRIF